MRKVSLGQDFLIPGVKKNWHTRNYHQPGQGEKFVGIAYENFGLIRGQGFGLLILKAFLSSFWQTVKNYPVTCVGD
jgi:hypothetical protein